MLTVEEYWLLVELKEENVLQYQTNIVTKDNTLAGDSSEPVSRRFVTMSYTFNKEERLCSKRLIESLFHNGSSFVLYPYRVVFLPADSAAAESSPPVQCILSVSKRRFKRAVDRNFIKRRMKEAYRLQKSFLYDFLDEHSLHLIVAFQYVGKEKLPYEQLHQRMKQVLGKLKDESTKLYLAVGD